MLNANYTVFSQNSQKQFMATKDQKAERFEIIFLFLKRFQQFIIPM